MSLSGKRHHRQAVRKAGKGLVLLVWRQFSRNKQNPAQFEAFSRALGNSNVPAMDGVEGTAEEGEIHGTQCSVLGHFVISRFCDLAIGELSLMPEITKSRSTPRLVKSLCIHGPAFCPRAACGP